MLRGAMTQVAKRGRVLQNSAWPCGALGRAQRVAREGAGVAGDDAAFAGAAHALAAGGTDFQPRALRRVEH